MGWFNDPLRHKQARKFGYAGGQQVRPNINKHNTVVIREHPDGQREVVHDPQPIDHHPAHEDVETGYPREQKPKKKGFMDGNPFDEQRKEKEW